jgi:hypothetical protein
MKRVTVIFLFFVLSIFTLKAEIQVIMMEYTPKGKNYDLSKSSSVSYTYFKQYKVFEPVLKNPQGSTEVEAIYIFYAKTESKDYYLVSINATNNIEQKIPRLVLKYIGDFIVGPKLQESKSLERAKQAMQSAVNKALDKTWLNSITNESELFSKHPEYNRNYAGYPMNYYEFFPIEENELTNPTTIENKSVLKSFFEDASFIAEEVLMEKGSSISKVEDSNLKKPDFDKNVSWQKFRYANLMDVMNKIKSIDYHHKNLKLSDWPLASEKNWVLFETAPSGFHSAVDSACKYMMMLQPTLKINEYMPAMAWRQNYGDWKATRCNIFVYDFAKKGLGLTTGPWPDRNTDANKLYVQLPTNDDFVKVSLKEAWLYASIGYPVMITTPQIGPAAHIGFAYPVDLSLALETSGLKDEAAALEKMRTAGWVVQAGNTIGKVILEKGFPVGALADANIYVYLGYLAK